MEKYFRYAKEVDTFGFDWGRLAFTVSPDVNGARGFSAGVVDLAAGRAMPATTTRNPKRSSSSSRDRASR